MSNQEHPPYCRKEREIGELSQRVNAMETTIEKVTENIPKLEKEAVRLNSNVEHLNTEIIPPLSKAVSGAVKFQQETEGRRKSSVAYRWVIGILLTVMGILIGLLVRGL